MPKKRSSSDDDTPRYRQSSRSPNEGYAGYKSENPPPDSKTPEADEERRGFYSFYMPAVQSNLTSAKSAIEKNDHDYARHHLDAADKQLENAKKDTEERIDKRDSEGDEDSPRKRGWLW